MDKQFRLAALTVLSSMVVTACGGGDSTPEAAPAPSENVTAAETTANQNPMCTAIQPFYWEVGDKSGVPLASGSVGSDAPSRTEPMAIASASKWLYASYAIQKLGGVANLDPVLDVPFLNFTSGYVWSPTNGAKGFCEQNGTVQECNAANNTSQDPALVGTFHYNSGHMEYHAMARAGLGAADNNGLAAAVLGTDTGSSDSSTNTYTQPLLAGGVGTSAANYAAFLASILSGNLAMLDVLKNDASSAPAYKVATTGANTDSPLADATNALGQTEKWNYSLGHWVEDDPTWGDHAFSSAGAFGFYPWIDKSLTYYGIVARRAPPTEDQYDGFQSAQCGRLIRQAFLSAVAVPTATVPTPASE